MSEEPKFIFPEPSEDSKDAQACLWCGGKKLIHDAMLLDHNQNFGVPINVAKDGDPQALVFKDRSRSSTRVIVCATCGYVHLFATAPTDLR